MLLVSDYLKGTITKSLMAALVLLKDRGAPLDRSQAFPTPTATLGRRSSRRTITKRRLRRTASSRSDDDAPAAARLPRPPG